MADSDFDWDISAQSAAASDRLSAAMNGNVSKLEHLLEGQCIGEAEVVELFAEACSRGSVEMAECIVRRCRVDLAEHGGSLLHSAAIYGQPRIVQYLLRSGVPRQAGLDYMTKNAIVSHADPAKRAAAEDLIRTQDT